MSSDPAVSPSRKLRREIRDRRRSLPLSRQREASRMACRVLVKKMEFLRARKIALYMAAKGELDPAPILDSALAMKKQCYLPIIPGGLLPRTGSGLLFQCFDPHRDRLAVNRYGILEPAFDPDFLIAPRMLDLVLTPLVAFDRWGNRLGMGQGFYDKTFARIRQQWRRPLLLGMAYGFQEVDRLDANDRDVPMDGILTEREVIWACPRT